MSDKLDVWKDAVADIRQAVSLLQVACVRLDSAGVLNGSLSGAVERSIQTASLALTLAESNEPGGAK